MPEGQYASHGQSIITEIWASSELLFSNKLSWLLILGPVALLGDSTQAFGDAMCFALSGIALIPCAERLSFVTEQVAEHTNGTIGALLNATFGNAPELLIATSALRSGYYRVVQLAMLGSMLTNLLLVFGMSCLVGGLRWQVQELRITSGNVSVGMLFLSVTGSLLPAALILAGQLRSSGTDSAADSNTPDQITEAIVPTTEELQFSRFNAFIMVFMYGCYLVFQLGTHKEEFDEDENVVESASGHQLHMSPHFTALHGNQPKTRRNLFCMSLFRRILGNSESSQYQLASYMTGFGDGGDLEMRGLDTYEEGSFANGAESDLDSHSDDSDGSGGRLLPQNEIRKTSSANGYFDEYNEMSISSKSRVSETESARRRKKANPKSSPSNQPGHLLPLGLADPHDTEGAPPPATTPVRHAPLMSFRVGIVWLFVITLCISAMSDILVDTIDGFAQRARLSEVFTSMVVVPFFSNVAEQVSAVLFAYRNEMDLCVGVTVGSAIQVMTFVLPGCVIIGMFVDRSMTLFFHAYETVCLFLAVVVVAAVLQGGTTNWLVGTTLISIYMMIAAGFWFHSIEHLSVDAETYMAP